MRLLSRWTPSGRTLVTSVPYLWLLLFFLIPFVIVLKIAFSDSRIGMPPYEPLLRWASERIVEVQLNFANFAFLIEDSLYGKAYLTSISVAFVSTVLCLLVGYPMAYAIARASPTRRNVLLLLVILPFWTSFLLRVYAWIGLLKNNGLINNTLITLGIIDQPILKERWLGVLGERSTFNGQPIQVRACPDLGHAYMYSTAPIMFSHASFLSMNPAPCVFSVSSTVAARSKPRSESNALPGIAWKCSVSPNLAAFSRATSNTLAQSDA
jgi:ABC-type sugar transport system permease subunit